jgi:hypothetical protein
MVVSTVEKCSVQNDEDELRSDELGRDAELIELLLNFVQVNGIHHDNDARFVCFQLLG